MSRTQEEIDEAIQILIKADEIKNNKDFMRELEPALKEHKVRIDKVLDAKDFWKQSREEALKKEDEEKESAKSAALEKFKNKSEDKDEEDVMHKGERVLAHEEPKISKK